MSKQSQSYELALPERDSGIPAYQWLYEAVRVEILSGRLRSGIRLPATRELARQYGLSRGTIVNAFDQLSSEGYIEGNVGSGTFVSRVLPEKLLRVEERAESKPAQGRGSRFAISEYGRRVTLFTGYENRPIRAFRANLPALEKFPMELWTKIVARCLRGMTTRNLMGCDPLGHMPLRQAIADYLSRSRGVKCTPDQVAIVSGVQEAIDITARLLIDRGDRVCVEDPGYPGAVATFRAAGAEIRSIEVTQNGIDLRRLPKGPVRLIYVTPGHQFPMGTTMSLADRLQLLAWAKKTGAVTFEDDYDSEYRYSKRPIPALQGLDDCDSVLYAGSFSKTLFPSLRIGYVVTPPWLHAKFEAALSLTARHAPLLEQIVLSEFLLEGHFERHLRRMREIYAARHAVLLEESRLKLAGLLEISSVEAGLQTVGWLTCGVSAEDAATEAAQRQVDVTPLDVYRHGGGSAQGLQMGFAALEGREIRRGVRELAVVLQGPSKRLQRSERGSERGSRGSR